MSVAFISLAIQYERDVVLARQRARQIAMLVGFDTQDQTRIATAVSEIARNAFNYAGGGKVEFMIEGNTLPQVLMIRVADHGPGIRDLLQILDGRYTSQTGMGVGIVGARRLMDKFDIGSSDRGTTVTLGKLMPVRRGIIGPREVVDLGNALLSQKPRDPVEEVQQQNQELLRSLQELAQRQDELVSLNRELEDTNRGVVALYAELDEKADHLRRADELKSRFLSNMTHEFRTPVNSIQALARLLLERIDGELTAEQERQVGYIRKAAADLSELVDDLLDLAKVEAGKIEVHPTEFEVANLFGALRGMLKPLLVYEGTSLVFEKPEGLPALHTDEAKVSQILRNFISNALKFTERGEVRVAARLLDPCQVAFSVTDTGIGIAPEDQERIFQEFAQIDHPIQRRVKGTGLGLPLCRKLAELLGGTVEVSSQPGLGSTFTATIPVHYESTTRMPEIEWEVDSRRVPVLFVEDSAETMLVYEKFVMAGGFQVLQARSLREARDALMRVAPKVIVLDIMLKGEDSWAFLTELKRRPDTQHIPVMVLSTIDDTAKGYALGADAYCLKPVDRQRLLHMLTRLTRPDAVRRVLVVDDEEISRYVLRQHLSAPYIDVLEATGGIDGLRLAREHHPDVICLDLMMPDIDGVEILHTLKNDSVTKDTPVVIVTSKAVDAVEHERLLEHAAAILPKESMARALNVIEEAMRMPGSAA